MITGEEVIDSFTGPYRNLSNFSSHWVTLGDVRYPTLEHAFQAAKTRTGNVADRERIYRASTPGEAKRLGRYVELRPNWDTLRFSVMTQLLRVKFTTHQDARITLQATGQARLVVGNKWHDQVWGDCRCGKRRECDDPGLNQLGELLTLLRRDLVGWP